MTPLATHLHAYLRGDEPRTIHELHADLLTVEKVTGERAPLVADIRTALDELRAYGMAACDERGRWSWRPEPVKAEPQGRLF